MDLVFAQILTLVSLFGAMLVLFLLPFGVLSRKPEAFQGSGYQIGVSLANCLSAGVFLATFFVGLLPEVRHLFNEILPDARFPVTETVVFAGFFLALFMEQSALAYKEWSHKRTHNSAHRETIDDEKGTKNGGHLQHSPSLPVPVGTAISSVKKENHNYSSSSNNSSGHEDEYEDIHEGHHHHSHHSHNHHNHGHSHAGNGSHHGHSHAAEWSQLTSNKEGGLRLFILLLALGVHSIFEGLALGLQMNPQTLYSLFVGVAMHECLVAFALGVSVARNKLSARATIKLGLLFASSIPVGQVIGFIVGCTGGESQSGRIANAVLQALAAGTFIHVTFLEVIPSEFRSDEDGDEDSDNVPNKFLKLVFLLLGFLLLLGCTVGLQHYMGPHGH